MPQCTVPDSMEIESSNYTDVSAVDRPMTKTDAEESREEEQEEEEEQGVMIALDSPAVKWATHTYTLRHTHAQREITLLPFCVDKRGAGELQDPCHRCRRTRLRDSQKLGIDRLQADSRH